MLPATRDFEAGAEIVPEFDSGLAAGLVRPRKASRRSRPTSRAGSSADLALGDLAADIVLGAVGVRRDIQCLSSTLSNSLLSVRWRGQQTIESGEAGLVAGVRESNRADKTALRSGEGWRRSGPSGWRRGARSGRGCVAWAARWAIGTNVSSLPNQPFVMDPAQAVLTDDELAGVVADNDRVGQKTMRFDAAPQGAFGGDPHRDRDGLSEPEMPRAGPDARSRPSRSANRRSGCSRSADR